MPNVVGALAVSLGLNAVEYFQGLSKAEYEAQKATQAIKAQFESIGSAIEKVAAIVGVGLGANAFKDMIVGAIDAQEELRNLGERAGISGAALSSLIPSAARAHTSLEDVANMSAKLSKALLEIDNAGSKSTAVFEALGIKAKDAGRLLADPAQAVFEISKRLNELPEGGTKAAAQLLLLGRSGGTTSAFMRDLAEQTKLVAIRTNEEIEAAAKFNDRLTDLGVNAKTLQTNLANALLLTLNDIVSAFVNLTTQTGGLKATIAALAADNSIRDWARDAALAVGTAAESIIFLGRVGAAVGSSFRVAAADIEATLAATNAPKTKLTGSLGFTPEEAAASNKALDDALAKRNAILKQANTNYELLFTQNATFVTDALRKQFAASDANATATGHFSDRAFQAKADADARRAKDAEQRVRDAVRASGGGGAIDDTARRLLDAQLKDQERAIKMEEEMLKDHQRVLNQYYEDGKISINDFYAEKVKAINDALQHELVAFQAEEDAIRAFKPQNDKERIANEEKLRDLIDRRAKAEGDFDQRTRDAARERDKQTKQYLEDLERVSIALDAIKGDTVGAGLKAFDSQFRDQVTKIKAEGGSTAQIDELRQQTELRLRLTKATQDYQVTLQELGTDQAHIDNLAAVGAVSELESLRMKSEATSSYISLLKEQLAVAEQLAAKSGLPADIANVRSLKVALEAVGMQTDLVADKFNKGFGDAFAKNLVDVLDGTVSLRQGIKGLEHDIVHMLNEIAANEIKTALFGKGGALSGGGGLISAFLNFISPSSSISGSAFNAAGGNALDPMGFYGIPGAASGTDYAFGGPTLVGERGPEIVNLPRGAQVIPNDVMNAKRAARAGANINISIMVPGNTSRATADQIAQQAGVAVSRAMRKSGG